MSNYKIMRKWDISIENPNKLMRALEDFFQDVLHYEKIGSEELEFKKLDNIEGVASFKGGMKACKLYPKMSMIKLALGVFFAVMGLAAIANALRNIPSVSLLTVFNSLFTSPAMLDYFIPGLVILSASVISFVKFKKPSQVVIDIKINGESFKVEAGKATNRDKNVDKMERIGMISEARLVVCGHISGKYSNKELEFLHYSMGLLVERIEKKLIPKFKSPWIEQQPVYCDFSGT